MNSHHLFNRVWVDKEQTTTEYIPLAEREWDGKVIKIPTQVIPPPRTYNTYDTLRFKIGDP